MWGSREPRFGELVPVQGMAQSHGYGTELAPAWGDRSAGWLGPACKGCLPPLLAEEPSLSLRESGGRKGIFLPSPSMEMPDWLWRCMSIVRTNQQAVVCARGLILDLGDAQCVKFPWVCEKFYVWREEWEGTWLLAIVRKKSELSRVFVEYFHCE